MAKPQSSEERTIAAVEKEIDDACNELAKIRNSKCFPLLLSDTSIRNTTVDRVYDRLRDGKYDGGSLDVVIDSSGGDIDAAYNLSLLFRRYGSGSLTFFIPRWAKSAATLLICAGDEIHMTPVAELGPLDPQITATNPFERRVESFSPLHIESTLQLIRDEFDNGSSRLAEGLINRLQFPLTFGSIKKSLDVGREYVERLLLSRMLKENKEAVEKIGKRLTTGYADHSWCITVDEAQEMGLKVSEIKDESLDIVWKIHKLNSEKSDLISQEREDKLKEKLKDLPPELLNALLSSGIDEQKDKDRS